VRTIRTILVTTLVATLIWFASGAASGALSWSSVIPFSTAFALPETIAGYIWQSVTPWNIVLPALGTLAFAAAFALLQTALLRASRSTFFAVWFAAIGASLAVSVLFAIGQITVSWPPIRVATALQPITDALPTGGYWGLVWGWLPALIAVLMARRAKAPSTAPTRISDAAAPTPRRTPVALPLGAALLVIVAGVGIAASAPAADDANRALYAETPVSQPDPAYTPPPPVAVAPGDFTIDPSWCTNAQLSLLAVGGDAATGHRVFTFTATNLSDAPCVLDGYPDVAFGNDESGDLGVNLFHGGSFLTEDAGATPITLEPGATARTQLGWNVNATAGVFATQTIWAAPYAGAERLPFPQELDITAGSTVAATAWEPDLPVTD
jgi:hypothetical protein